MFGSGTQGGISNLNSNNLNPSTGLGKEFPFGKNLNTSGTPSSIGLFGNQNNNTNAIAPYQNSGTQGGLFGNSMTNSFGSKPGMENKPSVGNNLFGGSFDKSNTGAQTSMNKLEGLGTLNAFSKPMSFGSGQAGPNQSSSMFGGINSQTNTNSNPYNYDSILRNIQRVEDVMPKSVTEDVFDSNNSKKDNLGLFASATKPARKIFSGVSYLSGLGKKLGLLGSSEIRKRSDAPATKRGIFTQSNFTNINENQYKSQPSVVERNNLRTPYRSPLEFQGFKKLVVTSKPSKFHLINADNVMNRKRRRIFLHSNLITNEDDFSSENEDSEMGSIGGQRISCEVATRPLKKKRKMGNNDDEKVYANSVEQSDGYWCSPSMEELKRKNHQELSHVENFIVGRVGRGQISYDYPVDLTPIFSSSKEKELAPEKILFGNIVEIDHKIVRAYHNSEGSPSIGFELNVPATISLEGVKPKEGVSSSLFINYLKKQIGMEFVTYDPVTCVWTFKVKHFSVWGLIDEEQDNDESNLAQAKRKQDATEGAAALEYSRIYDNETLNQELKKQKLNNQTKEVPGNWDYIPPYQNNILNIKRDLVTDEVQRQLALHKEKQTALSLSENLSDITIESEDGNEGHRSQDFLSTGPLIPKERRNYDYMKRFVSGIPANIDMNEIVAEKAYEPDISDDNIFDKIQTKPNLAISDDWLVQLELANDVTSSLNKYIFSDQLTVSWKKIDIGKADEILFSEFNKKSIPSNHVSTPILSKNTEKIDQLEDKSEVNVHNISSCLSLMIRKSSFKSRGNGYPHAEDEESLYFKDIIQTKNLSGDSDDCLLWFGSSLFDDLEVFYLHDAQNTFIPRNTPINRKEIFCEYLKSYNQNVIEELASYNSEDSLEKVFIRICAGNLKEAVELAIRSGNLHLAVLITFLDLNNEQVKKAATGQLNYWTENHSLSLIPNSILKIYKILSGEFSDILVDLPWNVALLVILSYGKKDTDIIDIFNLFINRNSGSGKIFDVLRFYAQFHSSENSKVFELIKESSLDIFSKWYYIKLLSNSEVKDDDVTTDVSLLFGQLLVQNNLWKEAIYVYSHIADDKTSESMVRKAIIPHIDEIISKAESGDEYLVSLFNVPESLIYEAIAAKEHAAGNIWEACDALISANLWPRAHECLLKELGPLTVISNNEEFRSKFVQLVSKLPESGHIIPEWNQGAGVYLTFIKLLTLDPSADDERLAQIKALTSSIPLLPEPESIEGHIALKLMSKRVGELALNYQKLFDNIKERIFNMKLGPLELKYFTRLLENLDI